jgi:hypothetical protein
MYVYPTTGFSLPINKAKKEGELNNECDKNLEDELGDCLANGQKTTLTPQSLKACRSCLRIPDGVDDALVVLVALFFQS